MDYSRSADGLENVYAPWAQKDEILWAPELKHSNWIQCPSKNPELWTALETIWSTTRYAGYAVSPFEILNMLPCRARDAINGHSVAL